MNAIAEAYSVNPEREWNRLTKDPYHTLEFLVTWRFLQKYLPPRGVILDVGGGPGRYSLELCRAGYEVVLLDLSARLLALAKEKFESESTDVRRRLLEFVQGDIQDLSGFATDSFDAILCLGGPLTHIADEAGRFKAISELVRVAKPGAIVFIAVMGYLAVLRTILTRFSDDLLETSFERLVQTGDDLIGATGTVWHFFRADELRRCAERSGLTTVAMAGCEGLSSGLIEATNELGQAEAKWKRWVELVVQTSTEPSLVDMAEHILYMGRAGKI